MAKDTYPESQNMVWSLAPLCEYNVVTGGKMNLNRSSEKYNVWQYQEGSTLREPHKNSEMFSTCLKGEN